MKVLELPVKELTGAWTSGGTLSGWDLYLFGDLTYIFTEWADIMPRTIVHKGKWRSEAGVLFFSQDADVTWRDLWDRRYLVYRTKDAPKPCLLGLDFTLGVFEKLVQEKPSDAVTWLRLASFTRKRTWPASEGERLRAELMQCCWRPEYFAKPQ